jgi:hypothetical protein
MMGTSVRAGDIVHLAVLSDAMARVETLLGLGEGA